MSPTGAAITPDALSTGLRQCQSESTISVTVGLSGVQTRSGGDLIDRHRTFPGGWGVNRDKRYLRERTREIAKCPRRAGAPPRSISARRRRSQSRSPRHAGRSNIFDRRAHASRQDVPQCHRKQFRDGHVASIGPRGEARASRISSLTPQLAAVVS